MADVAPEERNVGDVVIFRKSETPEHFLVAQLAFAEANQTVTHHHRVKHVDEERLATWSQCPFVQSAVGDGIIGLPSHGIHCYEPALGIGGQSLADEGVAELSSLCGTHPYRQGAHVAGAAADGNLPWKLPLEDCRARRIDTYKAPSQGYGHWIRAREMLPQQSHDVIGPLGMPNEEERTLSAPLAQVRHKGRVDILVCLLLRSLRCHGAEGFLVVERHEAAGNVAESRNLSRHVFANKPEAVNGLA
mmetsp:Transcript_63402/g.147714  ORF Transcript_63402/g.147714 Transcript_63402/m.147714 type:complete len:247 (-) Transcript_63402:289-1029(-)